MTNGSAAPMIGAAVSAVLVVLLLGSAVAARRTHRSSTDFYLAGRRIGVTQNTLAMFAAFILLSTLFTMVGHVALNGFDAFIFASGFAVSFLVALLIFASPLRNVRGYTIGDLFALRTGERPARTASLVVTLLLYATYTIVLLNAIGIVSAVVFGIDSRAGQAVVVAGAGLVAVAVVLIGGMLGVTRLLVVKAVLVIGVLGALTVAALAKFGWNPIQMLDQAQANALPHPGGYDLMGPGREFGEGSHRWIHLSKLFAVLVGHAALPYMFMRHFTASSGSVARRSTGWAGMMFVPFYLCTAIVGFAAIALVGGDGIGKTPPTRDITLPAIGGALGGDWVVGLLGALGLLIVTGVLAALLISAVTSATRDVRAMRGVAPDAPDELGAARRNTVVIGLASVVLGVLLLPVPTHALIPITVDLGGIILPAVIYAQFWKRFNTAGLMWTVFGGIAVTGVLFLFSGLLTGTPVAIFPSVDIHIIEFDPALIAVPVTFLLGYLGTISSRKRNDAGFAELQVRALTGAAAPIRSDRPAEPESVDERVDERARTIRVPSRAR